MRNKSELNISNIYIFFIYVSHYGKIAKCILNLKEKGEKANSKVVNLLKSSNNIFRTLIGYYQAEINSLNCHDCFRHSLDRH